MVKDSKPKASDHESYNTMSVLAFLVAPVGFILGIVYLTKSDAVERKLGEHLIVVSIFASIIVSVAYFFFVPHYPMIYYGL